MTPLEGSRVIDVSHALAGPFCTYHLGQLGAEVVKVEPPQGDDFRTFLPDAFDAVNGGKKSVVLDLRTPEGQKAIHALVRDADIFVENFRPGVAAQLGIDWNTLSPLNPRLIYCAISGFGETGSRAQWPAVEWSVQAATGLSAMYLDPEGDAGVLGFGMLDIGTGANAVTAILAALLERGRTGQGQFLEVTMEDAALAVATPHLMAFAEGRRSGRSAPRPGVGFFAARDRRLFVMAPHQRWFSALAGVLGEPSLLDDPRFATAETRNRHGEALLDELEARLVVRDAADWQDALLAAGVPAAAVGTLREVLESRRLQDAGMVHEITSNATDRTVLATGALFAGRSNATPPGPVPALGEHNSHILRQVSERSDD